MKVGCRSGALGSTDVRFWEAKLGDEVAFRVSFSGSRTGRSNHERAFAGGVFDSSIRSIAAHKIAVPKVGQSGAVRGYGSTSKGCGRRDYLAPVAIHIIAQTSKMLRLSAFKKTVPRMAAPRQLSSALPATPRMKVN